MSAALAAAIMPGGLADPVHDAQRVFRQLLAAFAYPGRIEALAALDAAPAPLLPSAAAVCLALLDHDTPLWLDRAADVPAVRDFLRFQCGCPIVARPGDSRFAVVADAATMPPLADFALGDAAYPERSTTVILQVADLRTAGPLRLRGPGIKDHTALGLDGLPARFWPEWAANGERFPCGVDVVLAAPGKIAALPRTVTVEF
ncbi:MAG TPA: phosphonate C-P lyase system protein PhnH [Candidatus Sulfotelmatobacter sp.]|nr:phosphonate C-P lyase system protein PhnH [Candidatus Sulfotelmatobacter sp.]